MGRQRPALDCPDCVARPVTRCGRCTLTQCAAHALAPGSRCARCERDWDDESSTRSRTKVMLAPPLAVLAGGMLFGLLMPISIGGAIGAALLCTVSSAVALGVGSAACHLVDRSARALFLRERAGALPAARLLPSPRHR
jgi:hypothetical protein